jgi:hypothetical protein
MDRGTATRIEEEWNRREAGTGRDGVAKLGDAEFSGAVEGGGAWLFMLNGRIVGASGGSEDTLGPDDPLTAYTAPHPSLPLLFAMQDRGGETEARYFTDDAPLAEVHETLSSGNFTGYVELSENVHSGDYYVVYYGGRALHAAFIGNAERLVTGEEAFERASDEVGIYEVRSVDLDVRDAPEVEDDGTAETVGAAAAVDSTGEESADTEDVETSDPGEAASVDTETDPDPVDVGADPDLVDVGTDPDPVDVGTDPDGVETESRAEPESGIEADAGTSVDVDPGDETGTETESGSEAGVPGDDANSGADDASEFEPEDTAGGDVVDAVDDHSAGVDADREDSPGAGDSDAGGPGPGTDESVLAGGVTAEHRGASDAGSESESQIDDEAAWREQKTVPALDPERSGTPEEESETSNARQEEPVSSGEEAAAETEAVAESGTAEDAPPEPDRIDELEAEIESLRERIESLSEERDDLRAERDRLAEERDRLQAQVRELKADDGGSESRGERDLTPGETLEQTDLLVRYGSKSDDTLADAHDGDATPESVGANLRLKTHTRFDSDAVTVNGEAFESFLEGTLAYRFARWLVEDLLFEIRETGNRNELRDLYDALPEIDRVEFEGSVTVDEESGGEREVAFDVVVRNQMGKPLLVADVDGDRDPTGGDLMEGLLDRTAAVAETTDSLSAAFLVTASFFHNEVHEQVLDATKTGFLDRDSRTSFVKAARNDGYHVCLIEAHDGEFHVSRPDL